MFVERHTNPKEALNVWAGLVSLDEKCATGLPHRDRLMAGLGERVTFRRND